MIKLPFFHRIKKTDFKAGFVRFNDRKSSDYLLANPQFLAPRKIDNRDMLLRSSDQGNSPHCAGYATAGYVEFINWKTLHYPKQVDGDRIYYEAKRLDGDDDEGTSLDHAVQAAINLSLLKGSLKFISSIPMDVKFALHQYGVVVGGFDITTDWNSVDTKTGDIVFSKQGDRRSYLWIRRQRFLSPE